jgi:RNA polymerase sigma-70 factor (ECF subfamily)
MKSKQDSFLELYEPIHDRFERFCRARVYGDMEYSDLMNDTLLIAFQKIETLQSKDAFLSFLFGICVRVLGSKNQKKREERFSNDQQAALIQDNSANGELHTDVHYLYELLKKLSDDQRESIILFEISGFSIKEIAEIQGANEDAVKQRLKRGRDKLSKLMNFESSFKTGGEL